MERTLSIPRQWLWALLTLAFGILPSLCFLIWVERNLALPYLPITLEWPWINLSAEPTWTLLLFDVALIAGFGLIHSALARKSIQRRFFGSFPVQVWRLLYVIVTGFSLIGVMGFWQHTGQIIWVLDTSPTINLGLSAFIFWALLLASVLLSRGINFSEFLGIQTLFQKNVSHAAPPTLVTQGAYRVVRHPIYLFLLAALLITPVMTLDRLILTAAIAAYLVIAIPLEERKLVDQFGSAYVEYRSRVPAIFPIRFRRAKS